MTLKDILLLGDERLYHTSVPVRQKELPSLSSSILAMHDLIRQFRSIYGKGRAIAAPQIGVMK
ncbi:MAG: peptide deformylase, partial [Bacteroidales bacterium]